MPKLNYEIKDFNSGIIANPEDERDIPSNAASFSLNIDPLSNGVLKGMPSDTLLKKTGFASNTTMYDYDQGSAFEQQEQQTQAPPSGGEGGTP
jgi:hypothetical protein